jgi:Rho-binding antiterminator
MKIMRCDLQDYVEIACMFHYQLELELHSGKRLIGRAHDTKVEEKVEYLVLLEQEANAAGVTNKEQKVVLSDLNSMKVLTRNARFDFIQF